VQLDFFLPSTLVGLVVGLVIGPPDGEAGEVGERTPGLVSTFLLLPKMMR